MGWVAVKGKILQHFLINHLKKQGLTLAPFKVEINHLPDICALINVTIDCLSQTEE